MLAVAALKRAESLLAARLPAKAAELYSQAERFGADLDACAGQRWTCFMLLGDYESAWRESDAIRARGALDPHRVWDGRPVTGQRVFIRSVHGLGDAVQMLRYASLIRAQAAKLTLQVAPALAELARCADGVDEVVAWEQERPFDVQLEITELPYVCRSTLTNLPSAVPYLRLPEAVRTRARQELAGEKHPHSPSVRRPRIGLVWTSSAWDRSRSIPFALLDSLLTAARDVDLWCLQPTPVSSEWNTFCLARGLTAYRAGDHSVTLFAACIAEMDLIITIDSFAAHLAGALNRPAWVLLKQQADWRWMVEREDSPWYPTLRLFRQQREGAWQPVIAEITTALREWVKTFNSLPAHTLDATLIR